MEMLESIFKKIKNFKKKEDYLFLKIKDLNNMLL